MTSTLIGAVRRRIVPNAWGVLTRAFSMHLVYAAGFLQILANAVPYMAGAVPWWVPVVILVAAPVARIISQGGLDADKQDPAV